MKKLSLIFLLLSSLAFAGEDSVIEDRVEIDLKMNLSNVLKYDVDYDVDVFQDKMNVEIEIESMKEPKINCDEIAKMVLSSVKENAPEVKDVNITIIHDQSFGEDKILFNKRFM